MARRNRSMAAALAALLLATLLGWAAPARAQGAPAVWAAVPGVPPEVTLESVFMVDERSAWAAGHSRDGARGFVYRLTLEGAGWQARRDAELARGLYAVVGLGGEQAVVAGDGGFIARRDAAGGWTSEGPGAADMQLRALQLFDGGRAGWALGSRGGSPDSRALALRLDGGAWREAGIELPGGASFVNAAHLAGGGGWAVGSQIWRLDGNRWRLEPTPDFCGAPGCPVGLSGVRAIDGERAWAVGAYHASCAICTAQAVVGARGPAGWADAFAGRRVLEALAPVTSGYDSNALTGLYFVDAGAGLAVGHRRYQIAGGSDFTADAFALRYAGGAWRYETLVPRTNAAPRGVFMLDAARALVVGEEGLVLSYGYGAAGGPPQGNPAQPVPDPGEPGVRHFAQTGHTLRGSFLRYWEQNGGLERFGYPRTEEFVAQSAEDGRSYTVQYFERARFELHPELAGTQYEVLLGLLGRWVTAGREREVPFAATGPNGAAGDVYFAETGHNMAQEFVERWRTGGGLAIYGYPISEAFYEVNAADGQRYLVQYFERNRFEHHPEQADPRHRVLLGLLGNEYLRAQGWQ